MSRHLVFVIGCLFCGSTIAQGNSESAHEKIRRLASPELMAAVEAMKAERPTPPRAEQADQNAISSSTPPIVLSNPHQFILVETITEDGESVSAEF